MVEPETVLPSDATGKRRFAMGALSGVLGTSVSFLVAGVLRLDQFPVVAVAEAVRDLLPRGLAVQLVHLVGRLDKPLLLAGTFAVLLALIGWAGVELPRRGWLARLILAVLALLGAAAVLLQRPGQLTGLLPVLAGWVAWMATLGPLVRGVEESASRRRFLLGSTAAAAGSVAFWALGQWVGRARAQVEDARRLLRLEVRRGTEPAGADLGISPIGWRVRNRDFYRIDTALSLPAVKPEDWTLRIHGMVQNTLEISYQDLVSEELVEDWITIACVSNEVGGDLIGNAFWSGVPVRELLRQAGVQPGADAIKQTSADGWTCGTPLSAVTDENRNALLAVAMNGAPLPIEHGFPVRMVVPGLYGYVSATKWLVDIEVTRFADFRAYWTEAGWAERGPVKTMSRIDVPAAGQRVEVGNIDVAGSAWAMHTGIEKVEISVDGSDWRPVRLGRVPNDDTWVQWSAKVEVGAGDHEVRVRATDKSGHTQTAVKRDVIPDGATGWHTVRFSAG